MAQTFRPPATQRLYDVCVVGSQLGGVVAGALLARRGLRVLHVAHDDPGFHYVDHGYVLPFGPAVVPNPRHMPAAEAVLAELGLATDFSRALAPSDPDIQVLLPRHRVDVSHDPAVLRAELKREWPKEAEKLEAAFATLSTLFDFAGFFLRAMPPLPPDGFGERRAVGKAIKLAASAPAASGAPAVDEARPFRGLEDEELVRSLFAAHRFLTYLDGPASPLSLVRLLGGALRGTNRLPGGLGSLREMVRRRIAESRGELRGGPGEPAAATGFEIEGGKVEAVRLADSPDAHVARAFVVATDADRLSALLPADVAAKQAAALGRVRVERQLLSVNLVVKAAALPPALGDNVLALRDAAGGDGLDNAVFLQVLPARRDARKGPGERTAEKAPPVAEVADERVVCASGYLPAGGGPEALREAAGRIREAVADAIPFFERHLVAESAPVLADATRTSLPPVHPLYAGETDERLGVAALPVRGPWKNLFFAGREVVPGLGVEGELYAGIQAAGHVAALLGRKDVLK